MKTIFKTIVRKAIPAPLLLSAAAVFGLYAPTGWTQVEAPTVMIESATALEGNSMSFVARLDKPNATDGLIGFSYSTRGVTATPDVDYEVYGRTASFRPGETETEIILLTFQDDIEEGSETFRLIASDPDGVKLGNTEAIGTITEPEKPSGLPEIAVLADYASIEEGGQATFTLAASPRPDSPVRVSVTVSQTGAFAASGQTGRENVTVDSSGRGRLSVATVDDSRNEATGAIILTVNPGNGYEVARDSYRSATTAVTDNDRPVVTIRPGSKISEGSTARFTLSASPRPVAPIDVSVNIVQAGDFAGEGQLGARTVTIATNGRGTLSVDTISDSTDEDDGTITASLGSGSGYLVGSPASASVGVSDGGVPTPRIGIRANVSSMVEGDTATFELTANPRPASPLDVRVEVTDSGDFTEQGQTGARTLTIGTDGTAGFSVATVNDLVAESDGTLTARVLGGAGYLIAPAGSASVTVEDESVKVSIRSDGDIVEGGTATFTLTADPAPPYDLGVEVSISQRGDFLTGGVYTEIVTIGTDGRGTISVDSFNDLRVEEDGAIIATVVSGSEYAIGSPARATANVSDTTPSITIAAGTTVIEGDTATFHLTANPAPESQLTVQVNVSENGPGSFAASGETGQRSVLIYTDGSGTLEIRTDDDKTNEPNGRISVNVIPDGAEDYYRIGSPASASLRVNDNDSDDRGVSVSVADAQVQENARNGWYGRTEIHFPVTLSKAASSSVRVAFETRPVEDPGRTSAATPGGFNSGGDYRAGSFALWVRFDPGETTKVLDIVVHDDDEYEELPETFEVVISNVYNAEIGDGVALGTILPDPDDAPRGIPVVTITGGAVVNEGQPATFKLTAKPAPEEDLVVDVTVYDDSIGSPASDYLAETDEGARQVVIPGLNKQAFLALGDSVATLSLPTVNDGVEEAAGKIRVLIEVPADGRYEANAEPYSAEVDVRDNDTDTDDGDTQTGNAAAAACVSDSQWSTVAGYYDSNANRSPNYGANWYRVLIAYRQARPEQTLPDWEGATAEPTTAYTAYEAGQGETIWSGWAPVRKVLQCLEDANGGSSTDSVISGIPPMGQPGEVGSTNSDETRERNRWGPQTDPAEFGPDAMPDFAAGACVSPQLRSEATARARETWRGPAHVERWLRVAQTFSGGANDALIVTSAEAHFHATGGQSGWLPVADALRCLENRALRDALSR